MTLSIIGISSASSGGASVTSLDVPVPAGTTAADLQLVFATGLFSTGGWQRLTPFSSGETDGTGWERLIGEFSMVTNGFGSQPDTLIAHRYGDGPTGNLQLTSSTSGPMTAIRVTIRSTSGRYSISGDNSWFNNGTTSTLTYPAVPPANSTFFLAPQPPPGLTVPGLLCYGVLGNIASGTPDSLSLTGPSSPSSTVLETVRSDRAFTSFVSYDAQATFNPISTGTITPSTTVRWTQPVWVLDPEDAEQAQPVTASGRPSEDIVMAGPLGDPSVFSTTTNYPGGTLEPGWPKGLRHGYAQIEDEGFITYNFESHQQTVTVPLDCVYTVAFSQFHEGSGGATRARTLTSLLKRVDDDTLVDIVRDWEFDLSGTDPSATSVQNNFDACLLSFEDDIGYVAIAYESYDLSNSHPQNWGCKSIIIRVDLTGSDEVFSVVASGDPFTSGQFDAIHRIVRLSSTRFVVAFQLFGFEDGSSLPPIELFWPNGTSYFETQYSAHAVAAYEFDVTTGTMTKGVTTPMGRHWGPIGICPVNESRFVIARSFDERIELRDRSFVEGTNSLHWPGLSVGTCDVAEDLSIVENLDSSAVNAPTPRSGYPAYGRCAPFMLGDTLVVAFPYHGGLTPSIRIDREGTSPGTSYSVIEQYDSDGLPLRAAFPWRQDWHRQMPTATNVAAHRFSLAADGTVTPRSGSIHVVDGSGVASDLVGAHTGEYWQGFSSGESYLIDGLQAETVDNAYAVLSWGRVLAAFGLSNSSLIPPTSSMYVATIISLDDNSPTGIYSAGYRHLGIESFIGPGQDVIDRVRLRNLPGTDYWIMAPGDGLVTHIIDGDIEQGDVPYGLPDDFYTYRDYGFYGVDAVHSALVWDDWDAKNQADLVVWGTYPATSTFDPRVDYSTTEWQNRLDYGYRELAPLRLWKIEPPPLGQAIVQTSDVRVTRPGRSA